MMSRGFYCMHLSSVNEIHLLKTMSLKMHLVIYLLFIVLYKYQF